MKPVGHISKGEYYYKGYLLTNLGYSKEWKSHRWTAQRITSFGDEIAYEARSLKELQSAIDQDQKIVTTHTLTDDEIIVVFTHLEQRYDQLKASFTPNAPDYLVKERSRTIEALGSILSHMSGSVAQYIKNCKTNFENEHKKKNLQTL